MNRIANKNETFKVGLIRLKQSSKEKSERVLSHNFSYKFINSQKEILFVNEDLTHHKYV